MNAFIFVSTRFSLAFRRPGSVSIFEYVLKKQNKENTATTSELLLVRTTARIV